MSDVAMTDTDTVMTLEDIYVTFLLFNVQLNGKRVFVFLRVRVPLITVFISILLQIALGPYQNLPAEIESLKCVLDLKNQEVRELRCCKMELEKQVMMMSSDYVHYW